MIRHFVNILLFYLPPSRLFVLRRVLLRMAAINVDTMVSFCGRGWIYGRGVISIGEGTWLSPGVVFYTHCDASIDIGSQCDIGPGVEFIVGSHEIDNSSRRAGKGIAKSIMVGNGTWIGAKVTVLDGVKIGNGCVIAAGSVVCHDVDDNCLIAGVPAIVKRKLNA
jgi:maltose O-acetyltransferase